MAMNGAGIFRTIEEAQQSMCLDYRTFLPDAKRGAIYEKLFRLYRNAYFALGSTTSEAASMVHILPKLRKIADESIASSLL